MRKSLEVKKGKRESRRKIKCVDTEGMNGDAKKRIRILHKPPVQKTAWKNVMRLPLSAS